MFKLLLLPVLAASVFAMVFAARVGGAPRSSDGAWPVSAVVKYGDSVTLADGRVLAFVDVVEDSRCPADAMCIWQGRAIVAFNLDGERFEVEFLGPEDTVKSLEGIDLALKDVQPYPLASQPSDEADYEVTVRVTMSEATR